MSSLVQLSRSLVRGGPSEAGLITPASSGKSGCTQHRVNYNYRSQSTDNKFVKNDLRQDIPLFKDLIKSIKNSEELQ